MLLRPKLNDNLSPKVYVKEKAEPKIVDDPCFTMNHDESDTLIWLLYHSLDVTLWLTTLTTDNHKEHTYCMQEGKRKHL